MTISAGVSFIGQSHSQAQRLMDLKSIADDLQRQTTTQKKFETLSGFGLDARNVLDLRASTGLTQAYLGNIDNMSTRTEMATKLMTHASDTGNKLTQLIHSQMSTVPMDMATIHQLAQQGFDFLTDLINMDYEGRYIFGGNNTQTAPFADKTSIQLSMQTEVTNWLNGTNTSTQLMNTVDAYSSTNLGFDPTLSSATPLSIRVGDNMDITYGAVADQSGMKEILRGLAFAMQITEPNAAVDIPTRAEFETVMTHIAGIIRNGVEDVQQTIGMMDAKLELANSLKNQHQQDLDLFQKLTDKKENADTTEVLTQLQTLQTQMAASYQVTHIVSQLSLVNYLS